MIKCIQKRFEKFKSYSIKLALHTIFIFAVLCMPNYVMYKFQIMKRMVNLAVKASVVRWVDFCQCKRKLHVNLRIFTFHFFFCMLSMWKATADIAP